MPIYEYVCSACGDEFEKIVGLSDSAPSCPACGGAVDKKISLSAFHLKGGGWYSDAYSGQDNRSPGSSTESESSSPSSSGSVSAESSSSGSGDSGDSTSTGSKGDE